MSNVALKSNSYVTRLGGKIRIASALAALLLGPGLSGCILGSEKPELDLEVPAAYREGGHRAPDAAVPALDWWRGFRSSELTNADGSRANLQSRYRGGHRPDRPGRCPGRRVGSAVVAVGHRNRRTPRTSISDRLRPSGGLSSRSQFWRGASTFIVQFRPHRELHARLLGQEPRDALRGRGKRHRRPLQSRSRDADDDRDRRQHLLPGSGRPGRTARRAPQSHRRRAHS